MIGDDDMSFQSPVIPQSSPIPLPPAAPPSYAANFVGNLIEAQVFIKEVSSLSMIASGEHAITCDEEKIPIHHLRRLTMASVKLTMIDNFMGQLTMLTHVNLSFNKIIDVSALAHVTNLETLDVSHNKIVSLEGIRDLIGLHTLRCQHNQIEALEPLIGLEQVRELWISDNEIPWTEFVYFMPLLQLRSLVMTNNPGGGKGKIMDFVKSLRPTLQNIDGVDIITEVASERYHGDYGLGQLAYVQDGQEFLKSTDGRIMLAQAQAQLSRSERAALQKSQGAMQRLQALVHESGNHYNNIQVGRDALANKSPASHGDAYRRGRLRNKKYKESEPTAGSLSPSGSITSVHSKGEKQGTISYIVSDEPSEYSVKSSGYGQQQNIPKFKAKHRNQGLRRKQVAGIIGPPNQDTSSMRQDKDKRLEDQVREECSNQSVDDYDDSISASVAEENINLTPMRRSVQLDPMKILRFGDNTGEADNIHQTEESMVALCLYPNSDGYARWRKGPVAVSFEKGRLFCSYKNGNIAAMYDEDGNGSIMDTHGKNVLLLTSRKKASDNVACAKVMNTKNGKLIAEYRQDDATTAFSGHHGSPSNTVTVGGQVGGGEDILGTPSESLNGSQKELAVQNADGPSAASKIHTWRYAGFQIEFEPSIWDLRIKFGNDRMVCEFSIVRGGRLLKEKGPELNENEFKSKKPLPQKAFNSQKAPLKSRLATDDHLSVRSDVNSIMKSLDNVISELDEKLPHPKRSDLKLPTIHKAKKTAGPTRVYK